MSSAKGLDDRATRRSSVGTGRVDVAAAVNDTVRADRSAVLRQLHVAARPNDLPVTHDLTFTNDGDSDVTLDLTSNATGGAFTLGASTVTVPAGGKATVPVTGDPQAAAIGRDVGWIVGTDEATGDRGHPHVRRPGQGGRALRPERLAGRPRRQPRGGLGRGQPGGAEFGTFPRVRRRAQDPAAAAGRLLGDHLPRRRGRERGPVRPRRAGRPGDRARPVDRRRARRPRRAPAPDHGAAAHRGPAAQGGLPRRRQRDGAGVPQRLRRPADGRRHLRVADGTDHGRVLHAHDPLAQG